MKILKYTVLFLCMVVSHLVQCSDGGGGSASAADVPSVQAPAPVIFTFPWLPGKEFVYAEMNAWTFDEALEHLQMATTLFQYLGQQHWFVSCKDVIAAVGMLDEDEVGRACERFLSLISNSNLLPSQYTALFVGFVTVRLTVESVAEMDLDELRTTFIRSTDLNCALCLKKSCCADGSRNDDEDTTTDSFYPLPECGHLFCMSCLAAYVGSTSTRDSSGNYVFPESVKCPMCRTLNNTESLLGDLFE